MGSALPSLSHGSLLTPQLETCSTSSARSSYDEPVGTCSPKANGSLAAPFSFHSPPSFAAEPKFSHEWRDR
jgi:hypothetical protein